MNFITNPDMKMHFYQCYKFLGLYLPYHTVHKLKEMIWSVYSWVIYLHSISNPIWIPAYNIDSMKMISHAIRLAVGEDFFAICTNPWIDVLFAKCVRLSSNFILLKQNNSCLKVMNTVLAPINGATSIQKLFLAKEK